MTVTIKFFAYLEEKLGFDQDTMKLTGVETIRELKEEITRKYPAVAADVPQCQIAVDMTFKQDADPLHAEREIAVIPPVSGG
ncbi:molybdopterin converting factor subunit 1 [Bacillus piscicola]|uniref:molybdopterin converting factor subunit 1 n=1 Tax=Bacillus piscicola TaxID=1632684 RepID=UPI001F092E69|nr:molybdopterin converting factor subunit 1 [Bacillus piscicola]